MDIKTKLINMIGKIVSVKWASEDYLLITGVLSKNNNSESYFTVLSSVENYDFWVFSHHEVKEINNSMIVLY